MEREDHRQFHDLCRTLLLYEPAKREFNPTCDPRFSQYPLGRGDQGYGRQAAGREGNIRSFIDCIGPGSGPASNSFASLYRPETGHRLVVARLVSWPVEVTACHFRWK